IQYSNYYKQHCYLMLILLLLIVVLNVLLLPSYGIIGAAMASFIAFIALGIIQIIFVNIKFNAQPYNYRHLVMILTGGFAYFISTLIPQLNFLIFDLILRSSVLSVLYIVPLLLAGYSPESMDILKKLLLLINKDKKNDNRK
ncbi:MAG: polysaccharide biosynthesis C-terminal domain-containing protein, partial [Bacteroidales bacterium]|nr:polysaccharide biosynthesis C-terminal domain-containing protein [Bacteroidales bacterium]